MRGTFSCTIINIGSFLTNFLEALGNFIKFLGLNSLVTILGMTLYFIYTVVNDKISKKKLRIALLVFTIFIEIALVYVWFLIFSFKAILLPCFIIFAIIVGLAEQ